MATLSRGIPVLDSLDSDKSVQFFKECLGFGRLGWKDQNDAIVARDQVVIHFCKCDDRIDVEGIDALYEEMSSLGVVHPNGPLRDQPWGMREFAIRDLHGNVIKFGQPINA